MAFSTINNRHTTKAKRGGFTAFLAAVLRRDHGPKETTENVAKAPQELNSRYFCESEHAAKIAQAQRDVNQIWY
jgi:hypothetical protein